MTVADILPARAADRLVWEEVASHNSKHPIIVAEKWFAVNILFIDPSLTPPFGIC